MTGWAVEAAGVEKRYGGVTALKGVDLDCRLRNSSDFGL